LEQKPLGGNCTLPDELTSDVGRSQVAHHAAGQEKRELSEYGVLRHVELLRGSSGGERGPDVRTATGDHPAWAILMSGGRCRSSGRSFCSDQASGLPRTVCEQATRDCYYDVATKQDARETWLRLRTGLPSKSSEPASDREFPFDEAGPIEGVVLEDEPGVAVVHGVAEVQSLLEIGEGPGSAQDSRLA